MERVLVAMSGGVDSSVAAARLVRAGFDVVGVTLHLWDYPETGSVKGRCCAPEDVHDARRVADVLGFPHYAFDRRELFRSEVVEPFVNSYLSGETPSPCVRCNRGVKIHELCRLADRLGASAIATGHYARIERAGADVFLARARDRSKDQSYFLHMLAPDVLSRLRFPLGDALKTEVRQEALELGLPGASKGESQELCFVPTGRYTEFVAKEAPDRLRPGAIVDASGRKLAEHAGVHAFTIGQRRNLGVATGERSYVVEVDAEQRRVRLGSRDDLLSRTAVLCDVSVAPGLQLPARVGVAVRYRGEPVPAELSRIDAARWQVSFQRPVSAVVKGQFAVFYDGDRVLGGGQIESSSGAPCEAVAV
ncbi:MAG TPA: tRNA 2-thiouridine(34) synthase MnmA [Polyangiaceae bacterium]|nr:tRNA 2-thiouridine(34) synthase MnmA [Polyangiaceae bacterium]